MDDKALKEMLLGKVVPRDPIGGQGASLQKLYEPFASSDSVSRILCAGCGAIMELSREEADSMASLSGASPLASYSGVHFKAGRCICCDSGFRDIALEQPV